MTPTGVICWVAKYVKGRFFDGIGSQAPCRDFKPTEAQRSPYIVVCLTNLQSFSWKMKINIVMRGRQKAKKNPRDLHPWILAS
ncbi:hypothetical protein MAC3UK_0045 [Bdellovibrio phage MAC3UK]|nr:hypothetical protein MAC3UK_0045 [Bdellovibrio phage MAC3UK]